MAKRRNKNQKSGAVAMDVSTDAGTDAPQAMDTSEGVTAKSSVSAASIKIKKETSMRRSKNRRKLKAVARAISKNEKSEEKVTKNKTKKMRVQSAKLLSWITSTVFLLCHSLLVFRGTSDFRFFACSSLRGTRRTLRF